LARLRKLESLVGTHDRGARERIAAANWQHYEGPKSILHRPSGLILSADGGRLFDLADRHGILLTGTEG
jgi:hypothetical protein